MVSKSRIPAPRRVGRRIGLIRSAIFSACRSPRKRKAASYDEGGGATWSGPDGTAGSCYFFRLAAWTTAALSWKFHDRISVFRPAVGINHRPRYPANKVNGLTFRFVRIASMITACRCTCFIVTGTRVSSYESRKQRTRKTGRRAAVSGGFTRRREPGRKCWKWSCGDMIRTGKRTRYAASAGRNHQRRAENLAAICPFSPSNITGL